MESHNDRDLHNWYDDSENEFGSKFNNQINKKKAKTLDQIARIQRTTNV